MLSTPTIYRLERQGCRCTDWDAVTIHPDADLTLLHNVEFVGHTTIGPIRHGVIRNARLADCTIAGNVTILNVTGELHGLRIAPGVRIENVGRIEVDAEATFAIGLPASVLDETGSRPVYLYPGLTAQVASLMVFRPHWAEETLLQWIEEHRDTHRYEFDIERDASITDTRLIRNVHVAAEVRIEGAARLVNGTIVNNAPAGRCCAFVGADVDAEGFIIEDGTVASGVLMRNVYVGQGASLEKGFTAHDSIFFANSAMENGEACAVIAAPFSVSMHKSTLLIASQASFFNAGSGTNFSNHMYKLGPVHWGYMERGVKTASNSYVMWGARIGAFSLVMGNHKTHPNTSSLPFSYLFGTESGETVVAPGQMLRSCGLVRDAQKWPLRDVRVKRRLPLNDHIHFSPYNPVTIDAMVRGLDWLESLKGKCAAPDGLIRADGLAIRPSAIVSGIHLYTIAILAYLREQTQAEGYDLAVPSDEKWVDLSGQVIHKQAVLDLFKSNNLAEVHAALNKEYNAYDSLRLSHAKYLAQGRFAPLMKQADNALKEMEALVAANRKAYKEGLAAEVAAIAITSSSI